MARTQTETDSDRLQRQTSNRWQPQAEPYERTPRTSHRVASHNARRHPRNWSATGLEDERQERLTRTLGWFSIGLGLVQIAAPRAVCRLVGLRDGRSLMRIMGVREIASGVGILCRRQPVNWLWARVGGDVMDLAILGTAIVSPGTNRARAAVAAAAVSGVTMLDYQLGEALSDSPTPEDNRIAVRVRQSVTVNRPAEELYSFWRDFQNLPRFMQHLESVEVTSDRRSRWTARGPLGKHVRWEAEITEDRPGELIAWRSVDGSAVENSGTVRFEPASGDRGTVIRAELEYYPPAGLLGATVAKLLGEEPQGQLKEDLHRLKQLLEAGEIITTKGQPAGRGSSTSWKYDHAGRRLAASF